MSKSLKKLIDINRLREFKNKLVGTGSAYVQTGAVDQTVAGTKTFSKPIAGSVTGSSGSCTGNAATATKLATARTIALSGAATGTATGFDGSGNITIPVTSLDASKLTGTASVSTTGNAATATTATTATNATNSNAANQLQAFANDDFTSGNHYVKAIRASPEWSTHLWMCYNNGAKMADAVSVNYANSAGNGVPAGVIIPFAGTSVPTGYLLCNGAAVSRTDYANLFAAIGTLYGAGNGSTTFNLPDARDRVLQGASGWHSAGSYIAAGLPNITGTLFQGASCAAIQGGNGAFYSISGTTNHAEQNFDGNVFSQNMNFSASIASGIYGASSTVQSPAIATNFIIKY